MNVFKINWIIQKAKLDNKPEIAIMIFPPGEKHEGIEIFVSLSDIEYNGVKTKGDIAILLNKRREPFFLFSKIISSIRCP